MIIIRDVLQYNNAQPLIAETKMTEQEFNRIKTLMLIGRDDPIELETSIYWYHGGYPPKPVYHPCPKDWRGKLIGDAYSVNTKELRKWIFKYKPLTDTSGNNI